MAPILPAQIKNQQPLIINVLFYVACTLLTVTVLSFLFFIYNISILDKKISAVDQSLLVYASADQVAAEREVVDYKKKVDDFTKIIDSHKISLNVFNFIEQNTLPNVWFSSFSVLEDKGDVNLSGEAENMEILSNQIKVFETGKDYISSINILSSQVTAQGTVIFSLGITLNPGIFKDKTTNVAPTVTK